MLWLQACVAGGDDADDVGSGVGDVDDVDDDDEVGDRDDARRVDPFQAH